MHQFCRVLAATVVAASIGYAGGALADNNGEVAGHDHASAQANVSLTIVNVLTAQGVKIWVPESIFAKKGDVVKLRLINKLDKEHGYSIPAFGVKAVVGAMAAETVTFTADKAGIFPISCQLHPPHVAGQIVILD